MLPPPEEPVVPEPEYQEWGSSSKKNDSTFILPHSREAEEATLGSIFIAPDCMPDVFDILSEHDFYIDRHKMIYAACVRLFTAGVDIDLLTVSNDLEAQGYLTEVGGSAYLTSLVNQVPTSINVLHYAKIVEEHAIRRRMISQAEDIAKLALDRSLTMDKIGARFDALIEQKPVPANTTLVDAKTAGQKLLERINSNLPASVSTGLDVLNTKFGGYPRQQVTLLIGDNSAGKTALSLQGCETLGYGSAPLRTLYITLEEPAESMVSRRVFPQANVPYLAFRNGTLTDAQKVALENAIYDYEGTHKHIRFDHTARTIRQISRSVKQWKPDLVIIDDLMHVYGSEFTGDNEASGLVRVVTKLKDIAIDANCAMVILHHLTAEEAQKTWPGQKNSNKQPTLPPQRNEPPSLDSMTWSKNLRFTVDMWLALVPDFKTDIRQDVTKMLLWMMKDKRGSRLEGYELYYDKLDQWFYDNSTSHLMRHKITVGAMPTAPVSVP